jgi:hypothetical protein
MSLFPIFKINKMSDKNTTDTIYVFYGSLDMEDDPNDLFETEPTNKMFADIFTKDELHHIKTNNIEVIFVNQYIHIDDSIGVIKLKICHALNKEASMSELYLYCLKSEKLNPVTVYQNLTQNDRLPLTKNRMNQLLLNLYDEDGSIMNFDLQNKEQYAFDDILKLDLTETTYLVGKPLGQKFVFSNEYPFIADPFLVTEYDTLLEKSRKETSTLSTNLLLETGPIFRNTIYLCLAKDVFEIAEINDISSEYSSKIYFPFLYQQQIENIEALNENKATLMEQTQDKLTPDTMRNFENVNIFYNIFQNHTKSDVFSQNRMKTGIKFFKIAIYPDTKIKIPIDVIFKLIHATQEFPLVKYNPDSKQENIYRLFAPELTVDGRKIPYLSKTLVFKLMRLIGKNKCVAVYTNVVYNGLTILMSCEFEDNGVITVYPLDDFDSPIMLKSSSDVMFENIDEIIKLTINPLIEQIKPFFEQSGLDIPLFTTINSENIEFRDMKYQTVYNIVNPIDVRKLGGCISSVFTVESSSLKKGIKMRYKRVSNYDKRDSQEAFIIEKIDQGFRAEDIIDELVAQFDDLTKEQALDLIIKIRSELDVIRGANKRRALMIKINPGFQTLMTLNRITSELTINVNGINDPYYLNTISVYIDSIIRITQDIDSCGIDISEIYSLCSGEEVQDIEFSQITAQAEQSIDENEVPLLQNEEPSYRHSNDLDDGMYMDDLLDILGIEENEEGVIEGGGGGDDSSSGEVESDSLSETSLSDVSLTKVPGDAKGVEKSPDAFSDLSSINTESLKSDVSLEDAKKSPSVKSEPSEQSLSLSSLEVDENPKSPSAKSDSVSSLEELVVEEKPKTPSVKSDSVSSLEELVVEEKPKTPSVKSDSVSSLEELVVEEKPKTPSVKSDSVSSLEELVVEEKPKSKTPQSATPDSLSSLEEEITIKSKQSPKKAQAPKKVEQKIQAQAKTLENRVRDITGMSLKYPNSITKRLEEREPQLFVKEKNDKINTYSRMCPFTLSDRRQPIILTKEERDEMVEAHPEEYDEEADFIAYGSDPKDSSKTYYYTCPRYWCLLTNKVVTEQDILDGKCGSKVKDIKDAIIPKDADAVPEGKYVFEFYDENKKQYPGFLKKKTESGLCMPCCFQKWNTTEIKNRRDICQGKFNKQHAEKVSDKEEEIEEQISRGIVEIEHYVKGPEKYGPNLGENRWGFLPIAVQKFLHEVNEDCQISQTNMGLKLHHTCIIRHGVENSRKQSFIACLANALFYVQKDDTGNPLIQRYLPNAKNDVPTIKQMKELIISAIDLDKFVKYQNGDLITSFADPELDVNLEDYKKTKLYKKITKINDVTMGTDFIIKVAQSFEKFKQFLRDDSITIDYTYLWDLVCMPNPRLFEAGINLIILEMPEDDVTNNIDLVCPTNHYSANIYDARKRSLILIQRDDYFEPIYGYLNDGKKILITKTFSEHDKKLPKTLRAVFTKIIKPTLGEKCNPFPSIKEYRFKRPPLLDNLITELTHNKYTILYQVMNFQGKVIGLVTKNTKGMEGFIPCYPSALTNLQNKICNKENPTSTSDKCDYDFVYVNDDIWKPYEPTLDFLKQYYGYKDDTKSKQNFYRVVEEELITGFLTNTNQFIPIKDPIPVSTVSDNIKTISEQNMLVADKNTLTNNTVDTKRVDFIKRIQLETNFYNVFRNTIRILFNDYTNSQKRKAIKDECNAKYRLYTNQLDTVINLLHDLINDTIVFASASNMPYNYMSINDSDLHTCMSKTVDKCVNKSNPSGSICRIANDKCQLVLPKINLVNKTDNEIIYYKRMADELIRYNRIKTFIFKPQSYLSFGQVKYNLRKDEIIILQDLITQEFFENLIPAEINKYAKYNTYDTTEPIKTHLYNNQLNIDYIINPLHDRDCVKSSPMAIKSINWRKCLPTTFKEIEYTGSTYCSLYLIIDIVKEILHDNITVEKVKEDLLSMYNKLTNGFKNKTRVKKIIDILKEEAQFDANQLQDNSMNFEQMIMQDGFVAVNFDLWLLLVHYQIPSLFISTKTIPETRFNRSAFVCYTAPEVTKYVFISTPAMYRRKPPLLPEYKLIMDGNKMNIDIRELEGLGCYDKLDEALLNYDTVENYIDLVFEKDITTKYKPRQKDYRKVKGKAKATLVIEEDDEEVENLDKPVNLDNPVENLDNPVENLDNPVENLDNPVENLDKPVNLEIADEEEIIIIPKKRKTKKSNPKITVNPLGKKKTMKKLPDNVIIEDEI